MVAVMFGGSIFTHQSQLIQLAPSSFLQGAFLYLTGKQKTKFPDLFAVGVMTIKQGPMVRCPIRDLGSRGPLPAATSAGSKDTKLSGSRTSLSIPVSTRC